MGIDITYIPMPKGFMYLFVIIDWYSRYIVDYELSSSLDKSNEIYTLRELRAIFNSYIVHYNHIRPHTSIA